MLWKTIRYEVPISYTKYNRQGRIEDNIIGSSKLVVRPTLKIDPGQLFYIIGTISSLG